MPQGDLLDRDWTENEQRLQGENTALRELMVNLDGIAKRQCADCKSDVFGRICGINACPLQPVRDALVKAQPGQHITPALKRVNTHA